MQACTQEWRAARDIGVPPYENTLFLADPADFLATGSCGPAQQAVVDAEGRIVIPVHGIYALHVSVRAGYFGADTVNAVTIAPHQTVRYGSFTNVTGDGAPGNQQQRRLSASGGFRMNVASTAFTGEFFAGDVLGVFFWSNTQNLLQARLGDTVVVLTLIRSLPG